MNRTHLSETSKVYLVGGGIASLAAAAFLIRDGDMPGHRITIFEESDVIGGSLDGSGSPENGYVLRGGRMLERKYLCTFDLFDSIPTLDGAQTVTQENVDVERDDEDVVEVAPVSQREAPDRAEVRPERTPHPRHRATGA